MGISRYHLLIEGRVQGVGYRMATQMAARQFALTGWVRNLSDGRVECIAEGLPEQLNQLVDWAKKDLALRKLLMFLSQSRPLPKNSHHLRFTRACLSVISASVVR